MVSVRIGYGNNLFLLLYRRVKRGTDGTDDVRSCIAISAGSQQTISIVDIVIIAGAQPYTIKLLPFRLAV